MRKQDKHKYQKSKSRDLKEQLPAFLLGTVVFLCIPLLHFKTTIDPVTYPRLLALAAILLFLLLYMMFFVKKMAVGKLFQQWPFIAVIAYLGISLLGLIFAQNPIEGLFDLSKWILFILLVWMVFLIYSQNPSSFSTWLKVIVLNAAIAMVIGLIQYYKFSFQNNDPNALYEVKGLMAHKNQYVISLFLMWPFIFVSMTWLNKTWRKVAVAEFVAIGLVLLILQTRSVWLAILFAGAGTVIISLFVKPVNQYLMVQRFMRWKVMIPLITLLIIFTGIFLVSVGNGAAEKLQDRAGSIFDEGNTSNAWRIEMWEATLELAKDNPVTGVGAGNWKISIYPYYSRFLPSVYRHWRSPHNDYLLIASEKGVLGLLAYLLFFAFLLYYIIKLLSRANGKKEMVLLLSMFFGISGYLVISFFSFPYERINTILFLALMSGIILKQYNGAGDKPKTHGTIPFRFVALPLIPVLVFILYFGWTAINMEVNLTKVHDAEVQKNWKMLKKHALKAYHPLNQIEPKYSFPAANFVGLGYFHKDKDYRKALGYFEMANLQHPTSIRVLNNMGTAYAQLAQYDSALVYYQKTLEIFPHYEFGLLNSARAFYSLNNYDLAYKYILSCDPKSGNERIVHMRNLIEGKLLDKK